MAGSINQGDDLLAQIVLPGHKNTLAVEEDAVSDGPWHPKVSVPQLLLEVAGLRGGRCGGTNVVEEAEGGAG